MNDQSFILFAVIGSNINFFNIIGRGVNLRAEDKKEIIREHAIEVIAKKDFKIRKLKI